MQQKRKQKQSNSRKKTLQIPWKKGVLVKYTKGTLHQALTSKVHEASKELQESKYLIHSLISKIFADKKIFKALFDFTIFFITVAYTKSLWKIGKSKLHTVWKNGKFSEKNFVKSPI